MRYDKTWKSVDEQITLLESRGLHIEDHALAASCLERIGYYRLSGYWYSFRERTGKCCVWPRKDTKKAGKSTTLADEQFKPGATLRNAVDLYVFDKRLRLLTLDGLERIEIALRSDISHLLGKMDAFAYIEQNLFHENFSKAFDQQKGVTKQHEWLSKHGQLVSRSKEEFVIHNKEKYGLPLPIWIACEVWDFGAMSTLYAGMRESEQDLIAEKYGIKNGRIFASWLRSLNYLRNVCAHHSRLWNRNIVDQPKLPPADGHAWVGRFETNTHARARCYMLLVIIKQLVETINPQSTWTDRLAKLLGTFPDLSHLGLNLQGMGAIEGWDPFITKNQV